MKERAKIKGLSKVGKQMLAIAEKARRAEAREKRAEAKRELAAIGLGPRALKK